MTENHSDRLIQRATHLLDESVSTLDATTLSRLNRARQTALTHRRGRKQPWLWGGLAAGSASAFALALALGLHQPVIPVDVAPTPSVMAEEDMLAADDNLDMYSDLEFYAWLDRETREKSSLND
jgi:hypothetical protein